MSATDELRRLLDECGVEYRWDNGTATWHMDGVMYNAWGYDNERLTMSVCHLTPEQAIAATLGTGMCRIRDEECDQCGAIIHEHANMYWVPVGEGMRMVKHRDVHFCPNCGRRVVSE